MKFLDPETQALSRATPFSPCSIPRERPLSIPIFNQPVPVIASKSEWLDD